MTENTKLFGAQRGGHHLLRPQRRFGLEKNARSGQIQDVTDDFLRDATPKPSTAVPAFRKNFKRIVEHSYRVGNRHCMI